MPQGASETPAPTDTGRTSGGASVSVREDPKHLAGQLKCSKLFMALRTRPLARRLTKGVPTAALRPAVGSVSERGVSGLPRAGFWWWCWMEGHYRLLCKGGQRVLSYVSELMCTG